MSILKVFLVFVLVILLQGCMDAAMTGAQVAYNHDNLQKTFGDHYITDQINRKLYRNTLEFDDTNISISTFHREVLLTGQAPNNDQRQKIITIVRSIPNVKKVFNFVHIGPKTSSLIQMSDSWITGKIKAKLIAMNDIDPSQIKVVTENGTVYFMGMVLLDQANIAIDVARSTEGVQNVVKLFTYLRIINP